MAQKINKPDPKIMALQRKLLTEGYTVGIENFRVDGFGGNKTNEAEARYKADQRAQRRQAAQQKRAAASARTAAGLAKSNAAIARANAAARKAEAEAKATAAKAAADVERTRLQALKEKNKSSKRKQIVDTTVTVGSYVAGVTGGLVAANKIEKMNAAAIAAKNRSLQALTREVRAAGASASRLQAVVKTAQDLGVMKHTRGFAGIGAGGAMMVVGATSRYLASRTDDPTLKMLLNASGNAEMAAGALVVTKDLVNRSADSKMLSAKGVNAINQAEASARDKQARSDASAKAKKDKGAALLRQQRQTEAAAKKRSNAAKQGATTRAAKEAAAVRQEKTAARQRSASAKKGAATRASRGAADSAAPALKPAATVAQLRAQAKAAGLKGYSRLRKAELQQRLKQVASPAQHAARATPARSAVEKLAKERRQATPKPSGNGPAGFSDEARTARAAQQKKNAKGVKPASGGNYTSAQVDVKSWLQQVAGRKGPDQADAKSALKAIPKPGASSTQWDRWSRGTIGSIRIGGLRTAAAEIAEAAKKEAAAAKPLKSKPKVRATKGRTAGSLVGPVFIAGAAALAYDSTMSQAQAAGHSQGASRKRAAAAAVLAGGVVAGTGYGIKKTVQGVGAVLGQVAGKVASRAILPAFMVYAGYHGYQRSGVKGAVHDAADVATFGLVSVVGNARKEVKRVQKLSQKEQDAWYKGRIAAINGGDRQQRFMALSASDKSKFQTLDTAGRKAMLSGQKTASPVQQQQIAARTQIAINAGDRAAAAMLTTAVPATRRASGQSSPAAGSSSTGGPRGWANASVQRAAQRGRARSGYRRSGKAAKRAGGSRK